MRVQIVIVIDFFVLELQGCCDGTQAVPLIVSTNLWNKENDT